MTNNVQEYVAAFIFTGTPHLRRVLLTNKKNPQWMRGRWNGVGGKIETGETPQMALLRELHEEINLLLPTAPDPYCVLRGPGHCVHFFSLEAPKDYLAPYANDVGEDLNWIDVDNIIMANVIGFIPNLVWLIPMALHMGKEIAPGGPVRCFNVEEQL